MKKKDICIIAAAQGISPKIISRFRSTIKISGSKYSYDVIVSGGADEKFYKTRIINQCLRSAIPRYKVIIQTDIDLLVPRGLLDRTFEAVMKQPNNCFHHFLRYVEASEVKGKKYKDFAWHQWLNYSSTFCSGCWNGMCSQTWEKTGGFNEEMYAWGSEDTEFYNRARRKGIRWINDRSFALVHVNHPRRQKKRSKENFEVSRLYSDKTDWLKKVIVLKEPLPETSNLEEPPCNQ